ncbi:MAG: hypothetical protein MUE54_13205 [Anaerolineae bacterium]|nr:hypothetical protein [Anaerolineae bacterium]
MNFLKSIRPSPLFLGVLIGLIGMTVLLPGGYDGWLYYFNGWTPRSTAPAWVYGLLTPLTLLPPYPAPFRWMLIVIITALTLRLAVMILGGRWIWALFSLPFLWTVWLGQIEFITIFSVVLGWLVIHHQIHPLWLGVAIIGLLTKVQVGWGIVALFGMWMVIEMRWHDLIWAGGTIAVILLATFLIYPNWLALWLDSVRILNPSGRFFDSSIFPIGLLAWGIAILPIPMTRMRRLCLVASATLLGSPYFANYHCITLLTLSNRWQYWLISWLTVIPMVVMNNQRFGWMIPLAVLIGEGWTAWRKRKQPVIDMHNLSMLY